MVVLAQNKINMRYYNVVIVGILRKKRMATKC